MPARHHGAVRTSHTDPLRIAEIPVPNARGLIGVTLCPGKSGPSALGNAWARDLALDFAVIAAWRADAMVTLLEPGELDALGVGGALGDVARASGVEWYHLPITDGGCPSNHFEARWSWVGTRLRGLLRRGERALIHCRGGLGRAGTIAARLLAELGADPRDAIALVRDKRPGAIENEEQLQHVLKTSPISASEDDWRSQVAGSLLGGALGDALGYRVEFDSFARIRSNFGADGVVDPLTDGLAVVSDDTQMTLFSLEALLRGDIGSEARLVEAARVAYLDWYRTQHRSAPPPCPQPRRLADFPELYVQRAPGTTCLQALADARDEIGSIARNDSKGCGTVMRSAPFGMFPHLLADTASYYLAAACSRITHGHPSASSAAGATAYLVHQLMRRVSVDQALDNVLEHLRGVEGSREVVDALHRARANAELGRDEMRVERHASIIGTIGADAVLEATSRGWVAEEALAIAVYACIVARDFDSAIRIAANHDGDSDSTAAVCGNLWGAMRGIASLNLESILAIDVLAPIEWLLARTFQRYRIGQSTHAPERVDLQFAIQPSSSSVCYRTE